MWKWLSVMAAGAGLLACVEMATAQGIPAARGSGAGATAPAGGGIPKNIDTVLEALVTIDATRTNLEEFTDYLRKLTNSNLVVNWNALAQTGITRQTAVDLQLKDVSYEQVVKTLLEILPAGGSRPNFVVGDNTLTITTNAELGKGVVTRLHDLSRAVSYSFNATVSEPEVAQATALYQRVLLAELERAGEPMAGRDKPLAFRGGTLAATVSERGHGVLERAVTLLNAPLRVGQLAGGTQLTASAKRAQEQMKNAALQKALSEGGWAAVARDPRKWAGTVNLALMAGTAEELAKDKPDIAHAVNDGGVVLVGPGQVIRRRTVLAVYDLRDVMRRVSARSGRGAAPTSAELQTAIVRVLLQSVKPDGTTDGWGELGQSPTNMTAHNGILVVFATAETHRTLAAALQDINRG